MGRKGRKLSAKINFEALAVPEKANILVLEQDGTETAIEFETMETMSLKLLRDHYPSKSVGGVEHMVVPRDELEYYEVSQSPEVLNKRPLMCTYNATADYVQNLFGMRLDGYDMNFFIDHPLVEEDGVPYGTTLRVITELLEPYGIRPSRVVYAPGYGPGVHDLPVVSKLGMNPLGLSDKATSNAAFAQKAGVDASKLPFNVDISDVPLRPAISFNTGNAIAGLTGYTGGHSVYCSPRSTRSSAILSVQLTREPWPNGAPTFPELEVASETKKNEPEKVLRLDLYKMSNSLGLWKNYVKSPKYESPAFEGVTPHYKPSSLFPGVRRRCCCKLCTREDLTIGGVMCSKHWDEIVSRFTCSNSKCRKSLSGAKFVSVTFMDSPGSDRVVVECRHCGRTSYIEDDSQAFSDFTFAMWSKGLSGSQSKTDYSWMD